MRGGHTREQWQRPGVARFPEQILKRAANAVTYNVNRLVPMKRSRKTWIFLLLVVCVIQFIQPKKNISTLLGENDISKAYVIPEPVHQTFTQKCYDCHSNHTRYPWYLNVQPMGWWFAANIYQGKEQLNFSEFKSYEAVIAQEKLDKIVDALRNRAMPVRGYVFFNPHAEITSEDEQAIHDWVTSVRVAGP